MDFIYIGIGIMLGIFCAFNIFKVLDKKFDDLLKAILILSNVIVFVLLFFTKYYLLSFFGGISELISFAIIYYIRRNKQDKKENGE